MAKTYTCLNKTKLDLICFVS